MRNIRGQKADDGGQMKARPRSSWLQQAGPSHQVDSGPTIRPLTSVVRRLTGTEDERRSSSHERLVPVSCTRCRACTPGLSTWWSITALKGELVSRWVSRLHAFSGYPVRT